jgi:hypothetical protein
VHCNQGSNQDPSRHTGVNHEQNSAAGGRTRRGRAGRRWRVVQLRGRRQRQVAGVHLLQGPAIERPVVPRGAAAERLLAVHGRLASDPADVARDAAAEGLVAVAGLLASDAAEVARDPAAAEAFAVRTPRLPAALALAALLGLLGAGCGSNASSDTGTVSARGGGASGTTGTAGDGGEKKLTKQEKAVKFAECMRANGVPHFPDPDSKGESNFGVDVSRDVWLKAVDACKALKPPGALSSKRTPKEQSASLRFAQCVRVHGVKDFPDPVNGEPLIDTYKIPSSNKPGGMTILNAATKACGEILRASAGGQG